MFGGLALACGAEKAQSQAQAPPAEPAPAATVAEPSVVDAGSPVDADAQAPDASSPDAGAPPVAAGRPAGPEVAPAGALALTLATAARRLPPGKNAAFTLTLTNTTSDPLDVPVANRNWLFWQSLEFEPDVEAGRAPHTLKYGYFPGEVHTLVGGASEKVTFVLHRTRDGKAICIVPPQKSEFADDEGC